MRRICNGCGNEIEDGADFCYTCGAWAKNAFVLNDEGTVLYSNRCLNCGGDLPREAEFCPYCGAKADESQIRLRTRSPGLSKTDVLAILLAVVPGFFNIFGLGQIVQRRWSKAFIFITLTIILLYLSPSFIGSTNTYYLLLFMQLGLFLFSLSDVFRSLRGRGH